MAFKPNKWIECTVRQLLWCFSFSQFANCLWVQNKIKKKHQQIPKGCFISGLLYHYSWYANFQNISLCLSLTRTHRTCVTYLNCSYLLYVLAIKILGLDPVNWCSFSAILIFLYNFYDAAFSLFYTTPEVYIYSFYIYAPLSSWWEWGTSAMLWMATNKIRLTEIYY